MTNRNLIGGYKLVMWYQPPTEIRDDINSRVSGPPVATYGKLSGPNR